MDHGGTGSASEFVTTRWDVVLAAARAGGAGAASALEDLCATYWRALYVHVRRRGYGIADAEDLTQAFFARLLEKRDLGTVDRGRGRFRAWLLGCLRHFLANDWDRRQAVKRGGGLEFVSLSGDAGAAERDLAGTPADLSPDRAYDRAWALALLEAARRRLRGEYEQNGAGDRFELLEGFLPGEESRRTQAEVGDRLGLSEGAVKAEVHRLKRRFGALVRLEILRTIADPADAEVELGSLKAALAG